MDVNGSNSVLVVPEVMVINVAEMERHKDVLVRFIVMVCNFATVSLCNVAMLFVVGLVWFFSFRFGIWNMGNGFRGVSILLNLRICGITWIHNSIQSSSQ